MVGKVKHVRQKLHQEAVKLHGPHILTQTSGTELSQSPLEPHNTPAAPPVDKEPTQGEGQVIHHLSECQVLKVISRKRPNILYCYKST